MKTKQSPSHTNSVKPTAIQLAGGLIISVGEARKLLGVDAQGLSNDELAAIIYELSEMAQALLRLPLSSDERLL